MMKLLGAWNFNVKRMLFHLVKKGTEAASAFTGVSINRRGAIMVRLPKKLVRRLNLLFKNLAPKMNTGIRPPIRII